MNIIRDFINAGRSGAHCGRGNKYYNNGDYENALHEYNLAAQYQEKSPEGINPALLEYLAMTHAQMGNLTEALTTSERALKILHDFGSAKQVITDAIGRLEYFSELLRINDNENLSKYLSNE
jgi:tetratricopeptide (TPR) repeat protein